MERDEAEEGGQGIHHLRVEFILKGVLKCLKQVCDIVGQKDLFGNNLIGAGDTDEGAHRTSLLGKTKVTSWREK